MNVKTDDSDKVVKALVRDFGQLAQEADALGEAGEALADKIRDTLDFAVGYCSPHTREKWLEESLLVEKAEVDDN